MDEVCCNTACQELCHFCRIAGPEGTCTPLQPNQDPRNDCLPDPGNPCGNAGTCNGHGGCLYTNAQTLCGPSVCNGSKQIGDTCDGAGTCRPAVVTDCWPYLCKGTTCPFSCFYDTDCVPGSTCVNRACTR